MKTTNLTLATGRTLAVRANYDDLRAILAERTLSADDGMRELTTTDGTRVTVNRATVTLIEEVAAARTRRAVGIVAAEERALAA